PPRRSTNDADETCDALKWGHHSAKGCEIAVFEGPCPSPPEPGGATRPTSTNSIMSAPTIVFAAVGSVVGPALAIASFEKSEEECSKSTGTAAIGVAIKPKGS